MCHLHSAQGLSACSTNAPLRYPQWPMARNSGRLYQSQWQRLPAHSWPIQQVSFLILHNFKVRPSPSPKTPGGYVPVQPPYHPINWQQSEEFERFLQRHCIDHITSSPHFHWSNGFIEQQVKMLKTALSTAKDAWTFLKTLPLELWSTLIAPNMPSLWEIMHNYTI